MHGNLLLVASKSCFQAASLGTQMQMQGFTSLGLVLHGNENPSNCRSPKHPIHVLVPGLREWPSFKEYNMNFPPFFAKTCTEIFCSNQTPLYWLKWGRYKFSLNIRKMGKWSNTMQWQWSSLASRLADMACLSSIPYLFSLSVTCPSNCQTLLGCH